MPISICESCDEEPSVFVVNLTNENSEVLDTIHLCKECAKGHWHFETGFVSNE